MNEAPIPVWVVTGPLGSGKTTALSQLVAAKPASENWVVLLNEFTDAGIDALTVASAATGPFDVRLVPGGCLCCAGEADFRRNLNELVTITRPNRILVEPSGLGHPAGIIDELLAHQAAGRISLELIIGLMTAEDLAKVDADEITRAVAEIADVLCSASVIWRHLRIALFSIRSSLRFFRPSVRAVPGIAAIPCSHGWCTRGHPRRRARLCRDRSCTTMSVTVMRNIHIGIGVRSSRSDPVPNDV